MQSHISQTIYDSGPLSPAVTERPCSSPRSVDWPAAVGVSSEDSLGEGVIVDGGACALPPGCDCGAGGLIVCAIASSFCAMRAGAGLLACAVVDAPSRRSARAAVAAA